MNRRVTRSIATARTAALLLLLGASTLLASACQQQEDRRIDEAAAIERRAEEIAHRYVIIDTHIDVPWRLEEDWEDLTKRTERGDFDRERAKAGGLDGAFMSIYTPADLEWAGPGKAFAHAEKLIDHVEDLVRRAPDAFVLATSPADVLAAHRSGRIALAMGMENGAPIEGKLENLKHFYDRGVRYVTLAHSRSNHLADSSYDTERPNGGLSDFGRRVVKEMNALGILIDISHLSDEAASEVLRISAVPPIASHSSARHFTPGFERNLSDRLIRAIARRDGVVMINFGSAFLTHAANRYGTKRRRAYEAWLAESGRTDTPEERDVFEKRYRAEHPYPYATVEDVVRHINHVVGIAGIPYVGIGSDFDGVGDSLPTDLKDVSMYPKLIAALLKEGYSEPEIEKIMGGNFLRVWRMAERYAASVTGETERGPDAQTSEGTK